ncbi:MAG: hypothetical protein HN909_01665 [Phycisphaerales bacterium]|jgi:predicted phosphodiesterase|nr:hypothetical protein [Phycisphaerales bacterium]MBT7170456.1 hypothetical protein [Phycisphaerales bacterium]
MKPPFTKLLVTSLLGLLLLTGCGQPPAPDAIQPFRFTVIADTHFGHKGMPAANRRLIRAVETYSGAKPTDLLICGDLTEHGTLEQWNEFCKHYGPGGVCKLPIKLCTGNHDRPEGSALLNKPPVLAGVTTLHGDLLHRWTSGGVEFLSLDTHPRLLTIYWLKQQLADIGSNTPVVLMFHYNVTGKHSKYWPNKSERALYAKTLRENPNIIAVFHGHHHETTNTTFANTPHLSPGSPKHRDVFLVCDVTGEAMRVRAVEYRTVKKGLTYNTAWETKINLAPKATPTP